MTQASEGTTTLYQTLPWRRRHLGPTSDTPRLTAHSGVELWDGTATHAPALVPFDFLDARLKSDIVDLGPGAYEGFGQDRTG